MIAFDYGGTLRQSDGHQSMRDLVAYLNQYQVPVIVISALEDPPGTHDARIEQEILALTSCRGVPLSFNHICFVYYPAHPTPADMLQVGLRKAVVMREHGAGILFDDSGHVVEGVRAAGLDAVQV
jgi:hypothetical protein